jgi:hypothetical protein
MMNSGLFSGDITIAKEKRETRGMNSLMGDWIPSLGDRVNFVSGRNSSCTVIGRKAENVPEDKK